ncbi:MAG: TIGR03943 family putative permease subunit [Spartobacteria bacterium]
MNAVVSRFAASGILMVWGIVLAYFYLSGRIASYLHPAFHIYTAVSGAIMLLLALALLLTVPAESTNHGLSRIGIFPFLLLTLPLLAATKISPSNFGATAVLNRGMVDNIADLPGFSPPMDAGLPNADGSVAEGTMMDPSLYLKKNKAGYIEAEAVDLLYAAGEPTMREDFENKQVEVIGQFLPAVTGNAKGDRFNLTRLFVMCCAADARPVAISVQSNPATDLPKMTWVKVRGKASFPVEGGRRMPVVIAESVTETEAPEESFLY